MPQHDGRRHSQRAGALPAPAMALAPIFRPSISSQGLCRYRRVTLMTVSRATSGRPDSRGVRCGVGRAEAGWATGSIHVPSGPYVRCRLGLLRLAAHPAHDRGCGGPEARLYGFLGPEAPVGKLIISLGFDLAPPPTWPICSWCRFTVVAGVHLLVPCRPNAAEGGNAICDRCRDVPNPLVSSVYDIIEAPRCACVDRGESDAPARACGRSGAFAAAKGRGRLGAPARARDDRDRTQAATVASLFLPRRSRSEDASSMYPRMGEARRYRPSKL